MSADDLAPDQEMRAAELALGLADGTDRATGEALLDGDQAFAAAHARWTAYALTLSGVRAEPPGDMAWQRLRARLPANDHLPGPPPARRLRGLAAIAIAFLLGLAGGSLLDRRPSAPRAPNLIPVVPSRPLVAVLTGSDRDAVLAVSFDPGTGRLVSAPRGVDPGRRVPQLWVIPAGGKPDALAVLPADGAAWRLTPARPSRHLRPGATLAISLEPAGGSPTGQPTGPVILTGTLAEPS